MSRVTETSNICCLNSTWTRLLKYEPVWVDTQKYQFYFGRSLSRLTPLLEDRSTDLKFLKTTILVVLKIDDALAIDVVYRDV